MKIDAKELARQFRELDRRRLPGDFHHVQEANHIKELVGGPLRTKLKDYDQPRAVGAGGSGLIISARFIPHGVRRVLKFPRKKIYDSPTGSARDPIIDVDPEIHALSKVSHEHITRLYDFHTLAPGKGFCMITELIEDHLPLDKYAVTKCCSQACLNSDWERAAAMKQLARQIYRIVGAFVHMHTVTNLYHFDVKPDNVLVSGKGHPYITDLGFARDVQKYRPRDMVDIGFTFRYAHPRLQDPYKGAKVTEIPEKAKTKLQGADLSPRFDIFAFGRMLQEILKKLQMKHGESIYSDYTFNYLHLVACLCLDGKNAVTGDNGIFVSDQAFGMPVRLFEKHKFSSFSDIQIALERLLGLRQIQDEVPELDEWAAGTINVSDFGITTLTGRVKELIEHPAINRLTKELQLGLLETVFPTATHTRFQHSLGVYHAVREYIIALYNDPENPTFRVLFSESDCKRALLATLVLDVGHTSFGHDLEEVDEEEFSHTEIGREVLRFGVEEKFDRRPSAEKGFTRRSLIDIISKKDQNSWGINPKDIYSFIDGPADRPIEGVYRDILDGQLDADKFDYLLRDSVESRVRYGHGLDYERFLRSLTTIAQEEDEKPVLRLAIKQKGAASAEAFAFARYQLYQSLYWHHTFRAIKAMLLAAAADSMASIKNGHRHESYRYPFRQAYIQYVINRNEEIEVVKTNKTKRHRLSAEMTTSIEFRIQERLARPESPGISGSTLKEDRSLMFLWKLSEGKAAYLLKDLMSRRYYKRVIEIPLINFRDSTAIQDVFKHNRWEFQTRIEKVLRETLETAIKKQKKSVQQNQDLSLIQDIAKDRYVFVVDLPLRGWTASGGNPVFVSDYKRRHFRVDVSIARTAELETLWSKQLRDMMLRIAVFRVFCEPTIHQVLTRVLRPSDILMVLRNEYRKQFDLKI